MQSYTFASLFEHACSESYSRVVAEKRVKNAEYEGYIEKISELKELIKNWLGDQRELLEELEDLQTEESYIREQWIYQQGFQACFYLLRGMGAFHDAK